MFINIPQTASIMNVSPKPPTLRILIVEDDPMMMAPKDLWEQALSQVYEDVDKALS